MLEPRAHGHFVSTIWVHTSAYGDGGLLVLTNRLAPLRTGQISGCGFAAGTSAAHDTTASVRVHWSVETVSARWDRCPGVVVGLCSTDLCLQRNGSACQ